MGAHILRRAGRRLRRRHLEAKGEPARIVPGDRPFQCLEQSELQVVESPVGRRLAAQIDRRRRQVITPSGRRRPGREQRARAAPGLDRALGLEFLAVLEAAAVRGAGQHDCVRDSFGGRRASVAMRWAERDERRPLSETAHGSVGATIWAGRWIAPVAPERADVHPVSRGRRIKGVTRDA